MNEKDKIVTIDHVAQETVIGSEGKKQNCIVAYLKNGLKPLILNRTNAKTLTKLFNSPYIEDWAGKTVALYLTRVSAFGDTVDAVRIRSKLPNVQRPMFGPEHKSWAKAIESLKAGTTTVEKIKETFDMTAEVEVVLTDAASGDAAGGDGPGATSTDTESAK